MASNGADSKYVAYLGDAGESWVNLGVNRGASVSRKRGCSPSMASGPFVGQ